jgi:predicted DCC family thiol-disulfide oxidoreductase YuxK
LIAPSKLAEASVGRNAAYAEAIRALVVGGKSRGTRAHEGWRNVHLSVVQRPFVSMQAEQSIVVDPKSHGGINSPHGLILFDGVCVLCSRGCRFVGKRDRRGYFRFVPMQLAEERALAEQLGINPDRPDSFAFVATGQGYVKSEAALRIARELPRWRWTWVFHFIPLVIRDAIYDLVARNRYRWFGRLDACILPNSDRSWPS